ncbi:MAG: phosphoglycerate mutase family protein [Draconibacterium sp.]|nr:phosphoglycerate mutase family protein [Draconibacterium sp.]
MKVLVFINSLVLLVLLALGTEGQEVILIRHAEVILEETGWMGSKKATEQRAKYDTAPVHQFIKEDVLKDLPKRITDTVYVSALPRSIATGWKLYGDSVVLVSMEMLNEFDLHVVELPLFLPLKAWTAISRGLWVLGLKGHDTETSKEGRKRTKIVADFIEERSKYNQQIILVTHGFLNRNVTNELKRRGWKIKRNEGRKNLGANILYK